MLIEPDRPIRKGEYALVVLDLMLPGPGSSASY
ncbi:hypothetical protein QF026_005003 [Streptomyces aurantiacus]|nr:hypothetical protein [Streptomyces aurantiacus]